MVKLNSLVSKPNSRQTGHAVEKKAAQFLKRQGLQFIQKNFTCKVGEIDLIMQDDDCYVFVEVRLRTNPYYADGVASITPKKQHKLYKASLYYLQKHQLMNNANCRFDVVSVTKQNNKLQFDWIRNAFTYQ